jgi:parallel beta-helix repeat protein
MPQCVSQGTRLGAVLGLGAGRLSNLSRRLSRRATTLGKCAQYEQSQSPVVSNAPEQLESRVLLSTFYVATNGADSNAGSLAKPFRTIQRAANLAQPGDTVLVRGGTYRETVRPSRSGTGSSPIAFKAYGSEKVTVSGADVVSGWSKHSGSVYKAKQGWDMGTGENQVFVDGQMMIEARWPNTTLDVSRPVKATADKISASSSSGTLYDSALTMPDGYWNGATMHIVPGQSWFGQTAKVTSYAKGKVNFSYSRMSGSETPTGGDPYFLTGKFKALDAPTEWFRDPDGSLYLWTARSDNPAGHTVEAKKRDHAFDLRGRSNIVVDGFNLFAATVATGSSNGIKLNALDVKYVGHYIGTPGRDQPPDSGIYLNGNNNSITNSHIAYGAGHGIFIYGSNSRAANNVIHDVDYGAGSGNGIRAYGSGHVLTGNTVYNTGREGIKISSATKSKVTYNVVYNAMLQTTDGGGIYTFGTNGQGTEIAYNRVYNVKAGGWGGVGIMLDNNSTNYVVHHNVVWNTNHALKLNYAAKDNKIYNNTLSGIDTSVTTASNPNFSGTVFKNNIFTKKVNTASNASFSNNINPGTDARFVDPAKANFQLRSNSPAVNKGASINPYTTGYSGSAPDIGALEYGRPAFGAGANLRVSGDVWSEPEAGEVEAGEVEVPPVTPPAVKPAPTPAPTPAPSAKVTLQAEKFDAHRGVYESATNVGSLDSGDWVRFDDVNFGSAGFTKFAANLTLPDRAEGGRIEVRVGGTAGKLLGTLTTDGTGGWGSFETQSIGISKVTGVQDVYLVFRGRSGVAVLDSVSFA